MQLKDLQLKRVLRSALVVLLLSTIGIAKLSAQSFTAGKLNYSINSDGVSVTITGHVDGQSAIGTLTIPETVTYGDAVYSVVAIGNSAFSRNSGITGALIIPNSITFIGNYAFNSCSGFSGELFIPNSVTSIGIYAFYNCHGFSGNLIIGNSVTTIGEFAFSNCTGFTGSLTIPNSVTSIGRAAFQRCRGFSGGLTISNSVTTINDYTFENCGKLTSLTIPNSVMSIGYSAFSYCSGFTGNLTIPDSMISIGSQAFSSCSGFTGDLIIPNSVTSIGSAAFYACSGFTGSLIIGNSVAAIGSAAFADCNGFTGNLIIPNSVNSIGDWAFTDCTGINSIFIPNSVLSIGKLAFYNTGWYNDQPDGVLYLNRCCLGYKGDPLIGTLCITENIRLIAACAFEYCSDLDEVIMFGTTPPLLGWGGFIGTNCPIYVLYKSVDIYSAAMNWSDYSSRIFPMAYKIFTGYSTGSDKWNFIASPIEANTIPTEVEDMIPSNGNYDLYRFNQAATLEWENYKQEGEHYHFNLVNGQGYLYANAEDVNLIFKGEFNEEETKEVSLVYDANAALPGWNLVGNPFPVSAYANRSYYVMNEDGTAIEPVAVSMETVIPVCTGVMVKADNTGETVTFSKTAPSGQNNQGVLQIAVAQANERGTSTGSVTALDKAIVSFNAGDALEKFVFNKDNAKLYIPQSDKDLAIACAKKEGELPLNFKATKNGTYTITVNPEAVEMDYLHLIDNMTGNDIDLLASPSYTFNVQTTDYASRFRLVFSASGEADGNNAPFAFINNGNIVFTGMGGGAFNASLQIVDVQGRIIVCRDAVPASLSTAGMAPGIYVLRLINGDDVKTQKIVVM